MLSGTPSRDFAACFAAGELVVGVDEAGRGPLAGPVVAAAVVLCKQRPAGLDDSKKLTSERRAVLEDRIRRRCAFGIGVVAKEHRDRIMREHARAHPQYGWHTNVGYSTPQHLQALREHGPCPLHRRSFAPVAQAELPLEISAGM